MGQLRAPQKENHDSPEASLPEGNCPETDTEEARLCPPDALPLPDALLLLLLPPDTLLEAVVEKLLDAVSPPELPPVTSAQPGLASCAAVSVVDCSSDSIVCDRAQLLGVLCTCASVTD